MIAVCELEIKQKDKLYERVAYRQLRNRDLLKIYQPVMEFFRFGKLVG